MSLRFCVLIFVVLLSGQASGWLFWPDHPAPAPAYIPPRAGSFNSIATGVQTVKCVSPTHVLLSCGWQNSQTKKVEGYRYSIPKTSDSCECYDSTGMACVAWCSNKGFSGFKIIDSGAVQKKIFSVNCPEGAKVLGCHIGGFSTHKTDKYRGFWPSVDGSYCSCSDAAGAKCYATCADSKAIKDYEVKSVYGKNNFTLSCSAGNTAFGCGFKPDATKKTVENFPSVRVSSTNTCEFNQRNGATGYVICGKLPG